MNQAKDRATDFSWLNEPILASVPVENMNAQELIAHCDDCGLDAETELEERFDKETLARELYSEYNSNIELHGKLHMANLKIRNLTDEVNRLGRLHQDVAELLHRAQNNYDILFHKTKEPRS